MIFRAPQRTTANSGAPKNRFIWRKLEKISYLTASVIRPDSSRAVKEKHFDYMTMSMCSTNPWSRIVNTFHSHPISRTGVITLQPQSSRAVAEVAAHAASPSPILTKQALAEMLACSTRQIEKLVSSGKLPRPFLIGNSPRWHREWIERFLAQLKPGDQLAGKRD